MMGEYIYRTVRAGLKRLLERGDDDTNTGDTEESQRNLLKERKTMKTNKERKHSKRKERSKEKKQ